MKIIKPSYEIINISHPEPLKFIEKIGRTCYKSETFITNDSAATFVNNLVKRDHSAMIEHVYVTIKFICDRGISHEIVRHRIASYAQESTRYCAYNRDKFGNEITVIEPFGMTETQYVSWKESCEVAEQKYFEMLNDSSTPQMARNVLPNSLKTELIMTVNLRSLRNFLKLRVDSSAHPQIREVAIPLLNELKERIPVVFDDI